MDIFQGLPSKAVQAKGPSVLKKYLIDVSETYASRYTDMLLMSIDMLFSLHTDTDTDRKMKMEYILLGFGTCF